MRPSIRKAVGVAGIAALTVTAAACGGGGSDSGASGGKAKKGGTLTLKSNRSIEHLDPQRTYVGTAISLLNRTMARSLTNFPAAEGANATKLIADGATDTGTASNGNKTWTFTVRDGMKWQDGKPVTCEDYKYGISRVFAIDQITGGPQYARDYLDIKGGADKYAGPYKKTGQALYDKAVVCDGNKITFHLNKPVVDFNQTVSMPAFAPVRKDKDTGTKYDFNVFSNGPYQQQGKLDPKKGVTLVRNKNWDAKTDPIRKAYPDKIKVDLGDTAETISAELIKDTGEAKNTVTTTAVPPAQIANALNNPKVKERSSNKYDGYTHYYWYNTKSKVFKNVEVRKAASMAVDRTAYVTALGGSTAGDAPDGGVINPTLKQGYKKYDPFGTGVKGDPAKAKAALKKAGVKTPVPITYTWIKSKTQDKVAAGVKEQLEKAGFKVTLKGQADDTAYYTSIQTPSKASADMGWAGWGADWPSGSTVVQPLFDGRTITKDSLASNYQQFNDPGFNKRIDQAFDQPDNASAQAAWTKLDQEVVGKYALVTPVIYEKAFYIYGSNVKNFIQSGAYGGYVDLAIVAVK